MHVGAGISLFHDILTPGAFQFQTQEGISIADPAALPDGTHLRFAFRTPGDGAYIAVPIVKSCVESVADRGEGWAWDGNIYAPTLYPSILAHATPGCAGWHGFLVKGEWREC
jgi:hypothetical protein